MRYENDNGLAHLGLIIAVVVVVAVVAFGGWYVWGKNSGGKNDTSQNKSSEQSGESPKDESMEQVNYEYPAEQWSDYKNENLGFAFKYPKDWGEIDVRFDREDFFLADFNHPTGAWGDNNGVYQRAGFDFRGHTVEVDGISTHGEFAKGYYKKDGSYYKIGGAHGDTRLDAEQILFVYDKGGIETLLIKRLNYGGYEGLELLVNIEDREIIGLTLSMIHPHEKDEYEYPAFSKSDVEIMKQVAASFREA